MLSNIAAGDADETHKIPQNDRVEQTEDLLVEGVDLRGDAGRLKGFHDEEVELGAFAQGGDLHIVQIRQRDLCLVGQGMIWPHDALHRCR